MNPASHDLNYIGCNIGRESQSCWFASEFARMAAELGQAGVPVQLMVTLDPVGGSQVSSNVRRSVNFLPTGDEDHFSVIAAHQRDLSNYVLGSR